MEEKRREGPELLNILSDSSPIGIYIVQRGKFQYVNERFVKLTGYSRESLIGTDPLAIVLPEDRETVRANATRMLKREDTTPYEFRILRRDSDIKWILENVVSIQYLGERAALGHFMDITERKQAEALLQGSLEETQRERRLLLALSQASHAVQRALTTSEIYKTVLDEVAKIGYQATIFALTEDGQRLAILHSTLRPSQLSVAGAPQSRAGTMAPFPLVMDGFHYRVTVKQEPVFSEDFAGIIAGALPPEEQLAAIQNAERMGVRQIIGVPLLVGGQAFGMLTVLGNGLSEADIPAVRVFGNQIAIAIEKAQLIEKVQQLAITDELTGLYNRRHFYELLTLEVRRFKRYARPLSLIMTDIDHFKDINDNYGHLIGDDVLRATASIAQTHIRTTDYVARFGGDEFAIIMPETGQEDAIGVAERLRQALGSKTMIVGERQIKVTMSLGVATCKAPSDQLVDDLIERADNALYEAKRAGRGRVRHEGASPS